MDKIKTLALAAALCALASLTLVVILAVRVAEVKAGLEGAYRNLLELLGTLNESRTLSTVDFCIEAGHTTQCFNATPICRGEPPLLVVAAFTDVTVGVRNGTLAVVAVPGHLECSGWSLLAHANGSLREVGLLDPLRGGEKLILECRG